MAYLRATGLTKEDQNQKKIRPAILSLYVREDIVFFYKLFIFIEYAYI